MRPMSYVLILISDHKKNPVQVLCRLAEKT